MSDSDLHSSDSLDQMIIATAGILIDGNETVDKKTKLLRKENQDVRNARIVNSERALFTF